VDSSKVLVGIATGDRIVQGMFFRLTFGQYKILGLDALGFFGGSFQHNIQAVFDKLDAADGLAMPASTLAVAPGQETAVFDVLVRPAAVGFTAADLANYLNELNISIELTSMTPVDVSAVQSGTSERDSLQTQLDASAKEKDRFAVFGSYSQYLKWIFILALIVALLYYGEKAFKVVKAVV